MSEIICDICCENLTNNICVRIVKPKTVSIVLKHI